MSQAADYMNITDKRVLVIGTETPWLEAVLLQRRPRYGGWRPLVFNGHNSVEASKII